VEIKTFIKLGGKVTPRANRKFQVNTTTINTAKVILTMQEAVSRIHKNFKNEKVKLSLLRRAGILDDVRVLGTGLGESIKKPVPAASQSIKVGPTICFDKRINFQLWLR